MPDIRWVYTFIESNTRQEYTITGGLWRPEIFPSPEKLIDHFLFPMPHRHYDLPTLLNKEVHMSNISWKYAMIHPETGKEHVIIDEEWRAELSLQAYAEMILAARECPVEVGGKHRVLVERECKRFYIPQIWIPSQICTSGHFTLRGEDEIAAMEEAERQGLHWEEFSRGHWHSHGEGPAVLSGIDLRSTEDHMLFLHNDWFASGCPWRENMFQVEFVVNRAGGISGRFSTAVPVVNHLPIPVTIEGNATQEDVLRYHEAHRERMRNTIRKNVRVGFSHYLDEEEEQSMSIDEYEGLGRVEREQVNLQRRRY